MKIITNMKSILVNFCCIFFLGTYFVYSYDYDNSHLFDLSFQELMEIKVQTGSLLSLNNFKKPASVTTITSQDIKLTPHRNLYDLIETYVPGAIFLNHYDACSIGFRGLISDRNNKILIMINNKVSNQKARVGALAELSNWDMSDIDRIEIIRGSGSVTYGPGAISAVINVITKNVSSDEANKIKVNYINPYTSMGISGQITQEISDNFSVFAYFSIQKTRGYEPTNFYSIMYNEWNSEDAKKEISQDYMSDYLDIPQKKLHIQFDLFDEINLWVRYNNSGSTSNGANFKGRYQLGLDTNFQPILGDYRNSQIISNEQFIVALENEYNINDKLSLSSSLSYDIENNSRSYGYFTLWGKDDAPPDSLLGAILDQGNIRNMYNYFSEREILGTFVLRSETSDNIRFAAGTSLSYNTWGAPFGEPDNYIRMGDRSNIISGTDSPLYGDGRYFGVDSANAIFVGNGWSTFMYSFFGEVELQILPQMSLLLSSRIDKDDYSDYLISPRFAFTYQIDEKNILKLIGQQSNRMNTAEELFFQNRAGNVSSPEKLNTAELIYSSTVVENSLIDIAAFYNNIDILSWNDPDRTTRTTGSLSVFGLEIDLKYKNENFSVGLNQSITQLIDWKLADGIDKSGVSYSDYYIKYGENTSNGYGNNLNNWSNFATKFYGNYAFFDEKLILHIDARLFWGFDGAKDGLHIVEDIIRGTEKESQLQSIIDFMNDKNFYDYDLRVNASISYSFLEKINLSAYLMNITAIGNNYRYKYEAGNKTDSYLFRMNVLEEPFSIGLSLSYEL